MINLLKNKFWIEYFFNFFPVNPNNTKNQLILRFSFLILIWFSGLLFFAADGLVQNYLSLFRLHTNLFTTSFIILVGTRYVSMSLNAIIPKLRPIINITDTEFLKFSNKIKKLSFSFIPILIISILFIILDSNIASNIQAIVSDGFHFNLVWMIFYSIFNYLLAGTAYWMLASIWLTIFFVSKQPLEIELSTKPNEQFHDLSALALIFSLFYFISITITILSSPIILTYPFSFQQILLSPNSFLIIIGALGVLLPFYNIHTALLKLKNNKINQIEDESRNLMNKLDEITKLSEKSEPSKQIIINMSKLYSLQLKKKQMETASEWPVDITFISQFTGVALIPIVARIFLEIMNRFI